jgi:hypothetical protein
MVVKSNFFLINMVLLAMITIACSNSEAVSVKWQPCSISGISDYSQIESIQEAQNGSLYCFVYGEGVFESDDDGLNWLKMELPEPIKSPDAFYVAGDSLYVGDNKSGVWIYSLSAKKWDGIDELANRRITSMIVVNDHLIVGCYKDSNQSSTVAVYNLREKILVTPGRPARRSINTIHDTRMSPLIFAGGSEGVYNVTGDGLNWYIDYSDHGSVWCIDSDAKKVYAAADYGLLTSHAAVSEWEPVQSDTVEEVWGSNPNDPQLEYGIDRVVVKNDFLIVSKGSYNWISWDAGKKWKSFVIPEIERTFKLIKMDNVGFIITKSGKMYKTNDLFASLNQWKDQND